MYLAGKYYYSETGHNSHVFVPSEIVLRQVAVVTVVSVYVVWLDSVVL